MNRIRQIYCLKDPRDKDNIRYIGASVNPKSRYRNHVCKSSSYSHKCNWIKQLRDKGLRPILEIIDDTIDSDWKFWEQHYISLYKSWGFKLTNGTEGGDDLPEVLLKYRGCRKGSKISEYHKKRISDSVKGSKNPCFGKFGKDHPKFGIIWSNEEREKKQRKVYEIDNYGNLINEYSCAKECGKKNNISHDNIAKLCRGAYGYDKIRNKIFTYKLPELREKKT